MRQLWIYLEVIYHLELYCVITDTHRGLIIKIRSPLYAKKQTNEQKKKTVLHLHGLEVINITFA